MTKDGIHRAPKDAVGSVAVPLWVAMWSLRHGRSTWVGCTKDDGSVAFILLARVSPGERVHDIKSMASAVHHDGDTTEGVTWNGQGAEAISAAAIH